MRLPLVAAILALVMLGRAGPAGASGQLSLRWDDCGDAGSTDNSSACVSDEGANDLYCAFTLDEPAADIVGLEVIVDLQTSSATLLSWWQMQGPGACRDGAITVNGNFTSRTACTDPWRDLGAGAATYFPGGEPGGPSQPNQARVLGAYAVRSDSARSLVAGVAYYALKIVISNLHTVTAGCAGCASPTCFVLNSVTLLRAHDALPPLETPGSGNANWATWMGASGSNCMAVPVKSVTWGRLKTLYR